MLKKVISVLLSFVMSFSMLIGLNLTNAYAFTIRTSMPTSSDANWKYYSSPINNYPISPYNGGNCTWYAYGRLYEVYGQGFCFGSAGNAQDWWTVAKNNGISTGSTPRAGSLIVWGGNSYGHVGFVESVSGSNVTWTESNYQFSTEKAYSAFRQYSSTHPGTYCSSVGASLYGYIYLDGYSPSSVPDSVDVSAGTYGLKNVGSGLMLDVAGGADATKTNVQIYESNGSNAQQFKVAKTSGGYYTLQPSYSTSYMVNQFAWTPSEGTNVNLYEPSGDETQGWYFRPVSGGYVISSAYNSNLVLTAEGSSNGSNVYISTYSSSNSLQIWSLTTSGSTTNTSDISDGLYYIRNNAGYGLDVDGAADTQLTAVQSYQPHWGTNQQYKVVKTSNGWYTFQPSYSTTNVLNQYAWTPTDGTKINLYGADGTNTQGWYLEAVSGGYVIRSAYNTNLVLSAASASDGASIYLTSYSSGNSLQIWNFVVRSTGLSLSTKSKTMNVDDVFTLTSTVTPANTTDKSVTYTSSDTSVAVVNSNGTVTAVGSGSAVITATSSDDGAKDTCNITVNAIKKNAEIEVGNSSQVVGKELSIPIELISDYDIYGGELVVSFDTSVLSLSDVVAESLITKGEYSVNKDYATGKCKIAFSGSSSVNGKIITLKFNAAKADSSDICIESQKLYDEKSNAFVVTSTNGVATITEESQSGSDVVTDGIKISTKAVTTGKGEYVDIPVNISGNEGMTCFNIYINYDNSVMYPVSYTKGSEFSGIISNLDSSGNDMTTLSKVSFIWENGTADTDFNGEAFVVRFKIKDDAANGKYSLTLNSDTMFTNVKLDDIAYTSDMGSITVSDGIKGDVTGDGVVNGKDVVLLRQYLAGWSSVSLNSSQILSADVTGDGVVNGKDVVLLRQYLAGWSNINW